jgi:hypothetical protein
MFFLRCILISAELDFAFLESFAIYGSQLAGRAVTQEMVELFFHGWIRDVTM